LRPWPEPSNWTRPNASTSPTSCCVLTQHAAPFELFEITADDQRRAAAVEFVRDGIVSGQLTPTIDRTFPLDDIAEAHRYLEAGGQVGKIVVTVEQHEDSTP
jgi:NADPH:quinone reductase-like Zn-dependent oxidoreductase